MRRALVSMIAVPALLLSACGGDEPEVEESNNTAEEVQETEDAPDEAEETTEDAAPTEDDAEETTEDAAPTEDDAEETTEDAGGAGGDASGEGQAAADTTKEWLVAFVNGEDRVCDMMLDLSSEGPMKDSPTDYDICVTMIPSMAGDMFDEETQGIIASMQINGAAVDGDTAVVGKDNFSEMFAAGMGDDVITLKNIDGTWYVDMNESFQ